MFHFFRKKKDVKNQSEDPKEKTLCDVGTGERAQIASLKGDSAENQRLREMGFCESAEVEKISHGGSLLCRVCGSKIAISKNLAQNVLIDENSNPSRNVMNENSKIILLSELTQGQIGNIVDFLKENDTCARLEEMGVTPGEEVEVIRYAPLGDPIEIKIRGYHLSLRKEEADLIQVRIQK